MLSQIIFAFIGGGILCAIAQVLIDKTKLTPARILVLYVSVGVLLYATTLYDTLFKIFGCGVATPLIGFGAAIGRGVKEAIESEGIMGILSGGLSTTAVGITLTLILGIFLSLIAKGKGKRL